ncbi:hypothetical protein PR202_gb27423 [Eleusine coracana subsp. coracana]|uniref:Werner Syndrome-like exonuclease n=1 Tax=Eleusine coracana subsp. coracana TaxID=191504 RepID=A0AAV5FTR1_ELECO|nr:hypothetical protein PR202_gb27423 [Eleusine coracana subsp. coracana]
MHPAAPSSSSPAGVNDDDDFHWDDAAEAELQAIEAAYASASASAKRRRLPDWTSPSPSPSCRPRYSHSPVSGGSTPSWVLSPHTPRGSVRARHQQISFSGKIVYCRTPSEVEKAATDIFVKIESMKAPGLVSLGFDLEWRPFPRRGEPPCKVAVMQLCMEKTLCYVMHIAHSGVPPMLKSLLEDSSSIKVSKFGQMFSFWLLPKPSNIRMGNWEAYVLSKHQLQYAATDAYISWYLYEVLQNLPDYNHEAELVSVKAT